MASFRIPYLVVKPLAGGGFGYYWQPSPALTKKGWKGVNLGIAARPDDPDKLDAARRRNDEVEAWRNGGAKPRAIKKFTRRETVAGLVALYQDSEEWTKLAVTTKGTYQAAINIIEIWATDPKLEGGDGNLPLAAIDRDRIEKLRNALMKPAKRGDPPRHYRAHNTLRVLRTLFQFAEDRKLVDQNPATRFKLAAPPPRFQIWTPEDIDAFKAAAIALGYPSIAFAVEIAEWGGQREADILKMNRSQWREITNLDPADRAILAGRDGKVMGMVLRQGKTNRWVGAPYVGAIRDRIEAAFARNATGKTPSTLLLVNDQSGRGWQKGWFIAKLIEIRAWAIDPPKEARAAGVQPRPQLAGLQFRDLRRTCIVRLGWLGLEDALISAISGHNLNTIKTILEVYMPRDSRMAGRAIAARLGEAARPASDEQEQTA